MNSQIQAEKVEKQSIQHALMEGAEVNATV